MTNMTVMSWLFLCCLMFTETFIHSGRRLSEVTSRKSTFTLFQHKPHTAFLATHMYNTDSAGVLERSFKLS